ncbi:Ubiquitin carboxyl-terminal hydrolase 14 [Hypsibius exemplaris]|uniref:Ubiquitin carboxyl-terminal hydrolase n=1 Tax=Hypsibius exemplaris TaxID=2072580 RepID=A0A9X6NL44_HYPEX|nr:Ubiquitin carboxyl-terminal hydrolase 14 [Hypsibius exemplaris]
MQQDQAWGDVKLTDGAGVMMMGSTEGIPTKPQSATKGADDDDDPMDDDEKMPVGLVNLGNTCYLNASLQCFRAVPELRQSLKQFSGQFSGWETDQEKSETVTAAIKSLYDDMDRFPNRMIPLMMVETMRKVYPRFAEQSDHGGFMQHDANEAWIELMTNLKKQLLPLSPAADSGVMPSTAANFVEQYLEGEFEITMKCKESETEPEKHQTDKFQQLNCYLDREIKYLQAGLSSRFKEVVSANAVTLGRNADFDKVMKISRLPAYLTVQMVRFYYKERQAVGAKVLKDVKFPLLLDVFDLCSPVLQKKLQPYREKFRERDESAVQRDIAATRLAKQTNVTVNAPGVTALGSSQLAEKDAGFIKIDEHEDLEWKDGPVSFPDDSGSSNSGFYELQAVLTHQGRTNNSGHYVAWVRRSGDVWLKFDDEKVTPVYTEEVLKLSGGGDWHCAYVLLYGPRPVPVRVEKATKPSAVLPVGTTKSITPNNGGGNSSSSHQDMPTD